MVTLIVPSLQAASLALMWSNSLGIRCHYEGPGRAGGVHALHFDQPGDRRRLVKYGCKALRGVDSGALVSFKAVLAQPAPIGGHDV